MGLDLSQAESRDVYMRTGDPSLIAIAQKKPWEWDDHRYNAALALGLSVPDYTFETLLSAVSAEQRQTGKRANHGFHYGMGARKLRDLFLEAEDVRSQAECQGFIDNLARAKPAIRQWQAQMRDTLVLDKRLTNAFGREFYVGDFIIDDHLVNMCFALLPQSDVADVTNQYGVKAIYHFLKGRRSRLVCQVHDCIMLSVHPDEAWEVYQWAKASLETPITIEGRELSIPVDLKLGPNWDDMEEFKRPPAKRAFNQAVKRALALGENNGPDLSK
jgi:DNA polymerase I-like protein with 3'-5' exonuclease and polymerase domains